MKIFRTCVLCLLSTGLLLSPVFWSIASLAHRQKQAGPAPASREDAYRHVQTHAMRAWKEDRNFRELVMQDPKITQHVPAKVIERAFELKRQLRNIDAIFARVFGTKQARPTRRSRKP